MDKLTASKGNLVILVAGVVMLIASFLPFTKVSFLGFSHSYTAWSSHAFMIVTIPALLGVAMAVQVAMTTFAPDVKMPDTVLGLTWTQVHLVFGFQATIMMLAFLIQDSPLGDKSIGLFLMLIAAIALLVGAVLRMQDAPNPAS